MRYNSTLRFVVGSLLLAGCSPSDATSPRDLASRESARASASWGPESPHFNLEVVLRGDGFGLVKFRQPNDENRFIYLDVWVRDLQPNTEYRLQRAVDTNLDGICTSTAWLTLGKGLVPQTIATDGRGTGREQLFRDLSAVAVGTSFDIHFQVINATTGAVVLTSGCYEFTVSQ